jgi:DNA-binding transcriptional LysR family regulator
MKITLDELQAFAAMVDTGSITAAAQRLDLTVSAASRTLARLEEKLKTTLLRRTTRRLELTEEGRAFLQDARSSSPSRMPRSRCSRGARCRRAYASTRRRRSCCT